MSMPRPIVFGEALYDVFGGESEVLGGAPFNVAWHLHGFGRAPRFVGARGDDERGQRIDATMRDWGMDTAGLQVDPDHATGVVHARVDGHDVEYDIVEDVAYDHVDPEAALAAVRDVEPSCLVHGTLALRGADSRAAFERIRESTSVPVFCDVNLRPPHTPIERAREAARNATWVKLNADELNQLAGGSARDPGELLAEAERFLERNELQRLVVTLGGDGALAVDAASGAASVEGATVENFVDPVGAGDAFSAVTLIGLLEDWPVEVALRRANAFAAVVVERQGATLPDRADYARVRATWESGDVQ